jgi:hypothetical protein
MENFETLSMFEMQFIDGGHDGTAYEIGQAVGHGIRAIREVAGAVAVFAWGIAKALE